MATITEIAPDIFRISVFVPEGNLQFNHFLLRDEEPLLFHAGYRSMFPLLREAVATLVDPGRLRWVGFSHFEPDECGALNQWLETAPHAEPLCSAVGAAVMMSDYAIRAARGLAQDETLATGRFRLRFRATPHLPHGWDAGVLFEETTRTLLCSDLFFHEGDVEPLTREDVVGRTQRALSSAQSGPLGNSVAYTGRTREVLEGLAQLHPETLALMHGSSFNGDGAAALRDLDSALHEIFGGADERRETASLAGEAGR